MTLETKIDICSARNGERCKDCILYGKMCEQIKRKHHVNKLYEIDLQKMRAQRKEENIVRSYIQ